mmetsp:Transcript_861/g.2553  ORF Transcript_861/g.2553 Transcript_861/m.2553 type:complete len:176 (-) Transcript_861:46-573(-)
MLAQLAQMFPSFTAEVVSSVLSAHNGDAQAASDSLLAMRGEDERSRSKRLTRERREARRAAHAAAASPEAPAAGDGPSFEPHAATEQSTKLDQLDQLRLRLCRAGLVGVPDELFEIALATTASVEASYMLLEPELRPLAELEFGPDGDAALQRDFRDAPEVAARRRAATQRIPGE